METIIVPRQPKRRGPVPKNNRLVDTHISLPEDLLEWLKHQPEGMAGFCRKVLGEEYERQRRTEAAP